MTKMNLIQYVLIVLSLGVILIGITEVLHGRIFNGFFLFVFIVLFFYVEWNEQQLKEAKGDLK